MRTDALSPNQIGLRLVTPHIGGRDEWLRAGSGSRMLADGRLSRITRGLYTSLDIDSLTLRQRLQLITPRMPSGAVLGGWAAAEMIGLTALAPPDPFIGPVPIYLSRADSAVAPGFEVLRVDLRAEDTEYIEGVAVVTAIRNAYDMARFSRSALRAVQILDRFAGVDCPRPVSLSAVGELAATCIKHRGNPLIRRVLPLTSARSRSILESTFRFRWYTEIAEPSESLLINATLSSDTTSYEFDAVDCQSGLVIEVDSSYHSGMQQRIRDSLKSDFVQDLGLLLLRLNASDLNESAGIFGRRISDRRRVALRDGALRTTELVRRGQLREEPMRIYRRAQS